MASNSTDWCNRPLERWNTATFRAYLAERHDELYGIPYIARNYAQEAGMMKRMLDEYGAEVLKRFIDDCFAEYKPTRQYPGINFAFMYSYMRARVLPRVLAELKREQTVKQAQGNTVSDDEFYDYL
jgi:hypothetical protein